MNAEPFTPAAALLVAEWPFPTAAAFGSAVRAKGIEREILAKLPFPDRKRLKRADDVFRLSIPAEETGRFEQASAIVAATLAGIADLPLLPREVDDILTIAPRERLRWTKDGRLESAGTRTVKLRGRAKAVTFHVFDPRHIEDVLDRDRPALWREEDKAASAEARRRGAGKAALTRAGKGAPKTPARRKPNLQEPMASDLKGWEGFADEGLLR